MFIPGCGCCGGGGCPQCNDEASQVVIEFSTGGGSGKMFDFGGAEFSIECNPQDYTIVLDITETCGGGSQQGYCLGTVSENGQARASNCSYWGGNERESYSFSYSLAPNGRTGTVIGGKAYRIFPGEAAWTFDRIGWSGETRVVPFNHSGVPFFSFIREWAKQRFRMFRFLSRTPPVVSIEWTGGGPDASGAVFTPQLKEEVDALGQPYSKILGVTVTNGGSGYNPFSNALAVTVVNGSAIGVDLRVSQMAYTPPAMSAIVSESSTTLAQLSVVMQQTTGIGATYPVQGDVPMWRVGSVTVGNGGSGYPPNASLPVSFTVESGYYPDLPWVVPTAFRAVTNQDGVVQSVVQTVGQQGNTGQFDGRGYVGPTASAVAVAVVQQGEIAGLVNTVVNRERTEPTVVAIPPQGSSGMVLSVTLSGVGSGDSAYWVVASVGVVTAGGGFSDGDLVTFTGQTNADITERDASAVLNVSRKQPTISATAGGTGATFTVQTTMTYDSTAKPIWSVTGVTFTGQTAGYTDGERVVFTVAQEDTVVYDAWATIHTSRTQPTVSVINPYGGTGATFNVNLSQYGDPPGWFVDWGGVTVTNGGSGYPAGGDIYFSVAQGDTVSIPAYGRFQCGITEPTVSVQAGGSGSGATLTASFWEDSDGFYEPAYYRVGDVAVTNGGTGYEVGDPVTLTVTNGETLSGLPFTAEVTEVDEDGAILLVVVTSSGRYRKNDGIIAFVVVQDPGWYYRNTGEIASISLGDGGIYYGEQVDSVSVTAGGMYYRQSYSETGEPLPPLNCTAYPDGWDEKVFESPDIGESGDTTLRLHPRVGERYTFKDVFMIVLYPDILEFPEVGHTATRVCEDPEITVTIQ